MANIKCIDVSEWQGTIDFAKVKKDGVSCVILRAGFGRESSQEDSTFEANYKKAKAAGLKVGAYWYSYADSVADAKKEAVACLAVLKGKTFELPVFYDMEDSSQTGFGKTTLTSMAVAFCDAVKAGDFTPGVYANLNWFTNYLDYKSLKSKYFIWLAQYNTEAQLDCDIWQYSSGGKVNGISGNVDMNVIYNDKVVGSTAASAGTATTTTADFETASVQALLMLSNRLGIIKQTISAIDNKQGDTTEKAILQMKKALGMTEDTSLSLQFIRKTYQAIVDALPIVGDVNGDGKVNIKDATALQKKIAGID